MSLNLKRNNVISGVTTGPRSKSPIYSSKGELNASSKKDAANQLLYALQLLAGEIAPDEDTLEAQEEQLEERRAALTAAWADKTMHEMSLLGGVLAAQIEETTDRMGFCRQLLIPSELQGNDYPEITVKHKYVLAHQMASASQVVPVEIREKRFLLDEFYISSYILIDNIEVARSRVDLLEEKYEEGLEAIMVKEDRHWKMLADASATSRHNIQTTSNFTPQFFARMRDLIDREGIPVATCVLASTLMQDIITGAEFQHVFDPVTQREVLETGEIGSLYNTKIYSDQVRQPEFRVLEDGEFYMVGAPINHGVILTRALNSSPVDRAGWGEPKKGWYLSQNTSMAVVNNKSVVKGKRI